MAHFEMLPLERGNNVLELYRQKEYLNLNPPYQRLSVWNRDKSERFVDSIINGFDIPKLYFHWIPPRAANEPRLGGHDPRFSVIDGKQRLLALWAFIDGVIKLPPDFVFFDDETIKAAGATYTDLLRNFGTLRARFDSYDLPVTVVYADDDDFIEQLFRRLNLQMPLSAPEQRNAFGAPLPFVIRRIAVSPFFHSPAALLRNDRLQHYDLAAKFLHITRANQIVSTNKKRLDSFVLEFSNLRTKNDPAASEAVVHALENKTTAILDEMTKLFVHRDPLLRGAGRVTLYFHVIRTHQKQQQDVKFDRSMLVQFDEEVTAARKKADLRSGGSNEPMTNREQYLREFDRHRQSPNDVSALRQQFGYLRRYLIEQFDVSLPEAD